MPSKAGCFTGRIVIVGGGFEGSYLATYLEEYEGLDTLLVDPSDFFVYDPLIHQVGVGEVPEEAAKIFYDQAFRKTRHIKAKAKRISFQSN